MIRLLGPVSVQSHGDVVSSRYDGIVGVGRLAVIIHVRRNDESILIIAAIKELHHGVKTFFGTVAADNRYAGRSSRLGGACKGSRQYQPKAQKYNEACD